MQPPIGADAARSKIRVIGCTNRIDARSSLGIADVFYDAADLFNSQVIKQNVNIRFDKIYDTSDSGTVEVKNWTFNTKIMK